MRQNTNDDDDDQMKINGDTITVIINYVHNSILYSAIFKNKR